MFFFKKTTEQNFFVVVCGLISNCFQKFFKGPAVWTETRANVLLDPVWDRIVCLKGVNFHKASIRDGRAAATDYRKSITKKNIDLKLDL